MDNFISFINEDITLFDIIFLIFIIYFSIQCLINGFVLSLISFLKWILALLITIKLFPIVESQASDYIDMNKYAFVIGLGIFIYIISLFILIMLGKSLGQLSYAGIGSADKIFGFFFGIFKGYVFAVCIFVIADKFDLYKKLDISTNNSVFFPLVEWGGGLLIDNFPSQKDFEKTKELLTLTKVLEKMPDVTFYWAGDGPYRDDVLPILEKFDNFKWLGALEYPDKVRDFLTEIDVYALLSGIDMSPLTLLEAQLMEKPVIATNVGGIPELMKNNETGFLIEKSDHQTLIEKLELILNDSQKASSLGKTGKEFVSSNFNWKIIAKNFVSIANENAN